MHVKAMIIDDFNSRYIYGRTFLSDIYHRRGDFAGDRTTLINLGTAMVTLTAHQGLVLVGGRRSLNSWFAHSDGNLSVTVQANCSFAVESHHEGGHIQKVKTGAKSLVNRVSLRSFRSLKRARATARGIRGDSMDEGRGLMGVSITPILTADVHNHPGTVAGPTQDISAFADLLDFGNRHAHQPGDLAAVSI